MSQFGNLKVHDGIEFKLNYQSTNTMKMDIVAEPSTAWTMKWPANTPTSQSTWAIATDGTVTYQPLAGGGSVTSVALALPSAVFNITGSPITESGTLTGAFANQSANYVFAAPDGSTGTPGFRLLLAADIPSLTAAKISNFDTQVRSSRLDQMTAPTSSVSFNSQKITGLAEPTQAQDAATKNYVDTAIVGARAYKGTADASAASPAAATGTAIFTNGDMYRISVAGATAFGYQLNVNDFVTYNGTGWDKTDNTDPSVTGTTNRITVTPTGDTSYAVNIASNYVGQATITTLGTIATGTWQGTTIAVANGGTGATTAAAARTNLSAAGKASGTFTSSSLTSGQYAIPHNLGEQFPCVVIFNNLGEEIEPDKKVGTSSNTFTVDLTSFNTPTAISGTWNWTAIG
jgi:hypothetical protein